MMREVVRWKNASFHINRWYMFLHFWEFAGYHEGDPELISYSGITYTAWGARRRLRKVLLRRL